MIKNNSNNLQSRGTIADDPSDLFRSHNPNKELQIPVEFDITDLNVVFAKSPRANNGFKTPLFTSIPNGTTVSITPQSLQTTVTKKGKERYTLVTNQGEQYRLTQSYAVKFAQILEALEAKGGKEAIAHLKIGRTTGAKPRIVFQTAKA